MSTEEDQLRGLFAHLADRQAALGTDGAFLKERMRRRHARQVLAAGSLAVLTVAGVVTVVNLLARGSGPSVVAVDPTTPPATEEPLPTLEPVPSATPRAPAPVPPPLTAQTGAQLVVVQETRLELLDVDSGRRTLLTTDPRLLGNDRIDVLAIDGELVMLGDNQTGAGVGPTDVFVTTAGPGSPLRLIGQGSAVQASAHAHRVWLYSQEEDGVGPSSSLVEVDLTGRVQQSGAFPGTWNVAPFAGGFLRPTVEKDGMDGSDTQLVDGQNRRLRAFQGSVLAMQGSTAVLADRACPRDCVATILTASGSSIQSKQRSTALDLSSAAVLSPDRRLLFIQEPAAAAAATNITTLDLADGSNRQIDDAWGAQYYGPSIGFSTDGRWMFFIDANEKSVNAYDLIVHRTYRVPGTFKTITQLEPLG
jgi:hypothetical protein